jgi:hypothetical protein
VSWNETYQIMVKKLQKKTVYYKKTTECQHLIFWAGSQERVYCHYKTGAESEEFNRWGSLVSEHKCLIKHSKQHGKVNILCHLHIFHMMCCLYETWQKCKRHIMDTAKILISIAFALPWSGVKHVIFFHKAGPKSKYGYGPTID